MPQKYDVAGLGNAIVDVIASVDDRFLLHHGIAKGAMTLIDEFRAQELHKALATAARPNAGGSGRQHHGGPGLAGRARGVPGQGVRRPAGRACSAKSMKSLGVDFTTPPAIGGSSTGFVMIAVTPDGQRSMNTYLGACRELTPDDVDENEVAAAKILYIEGYLWDEEAAKEASRKAIARRRKRGRPKCALSLSDSFCVGRFRDEFLDLLDA